ncbi:MAG: S8 family serine peptidase [Armatimonadota bacterium]|nr:S8 family serine peptidase [Armatimonadota bacterium]
MAILDDGIDSILADRFAVVVDVRSRKQRGGSRTALRDSKNALCHGSLCTLILLSICPKAELYMVRVLSDAMIGNLTDILEGIEWVYQNRVDVALLAFGTTDAVPGPELSVACELAKQRGVILIAAGYPTTSNLPASYPSVVGVSTACFAESHTSSQNSTAIDVYCDGHYPQEICHLLKRGELECASFAAARFAGIVAELKRINQGLMNEDLLDKAREQVRSERRTKEN